MAEGLHALMTRATLASFKRALRAQLPELRSAHTDEVIAAGLGFRTHAALVTAFGGNHELAVVLDLDQAKARLLELCPGADTFLLGPAVDEFIHGNMRAVIEAQRRRMVAAIANDN